MYSSLDPLFGTVSKNPALPLSIRSERYVFAGIKKNQAISPSEMA